jgi:DNA repair photolyase
MRWSGQELGVEADDALPGLARLNNLVRSVQTPEFAGLTFHEVLAKSALNHVPGASKALPFGWTINPYRGCSHQCVFCLSPETLILMADGSETPLAEVQAGDEIYGTESRGRYRRYVRATVQAKWSTRKRAFRVELADGTVLIASGDHRFLTERGWKHVQRADQPAQRPYLTTNNRLMGFGTAGATIPVAQGPDYRRGYLNGMIRGDGMIFHGTYADTRRVRTIHRFRLALKDGEALERSRRYLRDAGIETLLREFPSSGAPMMAIHTAKQADVATIEELIASPSARSTEWNAGFLAGVFDAEGSWSRGIARFTNKSLELLGEIRDALSQLGIASVLEGPRPNGVASVRVIGGLGACRRLFRIVQPAITRKLSMDGWAVKTSSDLTVVKIDDLGVDVDLIDITTSTGDFIANGVISHNCFARNTHTYLDLDAGRDFDTQIIVKVNLVEVLERELARPSWQRPNVALGTNTDPYQRAEGRYRLMPGVISALAASETPLSILTKGTLLRRDIPLLQAAAERIPVETAMSIAIYDDELQRSIEPGAPSTAARLATVRAVRDAGLPCSVFLMPVLPYLTDSREHLECALERIADAGATSVAYSALHLRPGAKEWFAAWLAREHPELVSRYRALYGAGAYAPKEYRRQLAGRIRPLLRRHGLDRPHVDPATGSMGARPRQANAGVGALAAELSPAAAAALQPTLF